MSSESLCDMCHRVIEPHAHYVVKIEVFADPTMPPVSRDELAETDYREKIRTLLEAMKDASPRELQDGVHRRLNFRICVPCQRRYLENPLPCD